MALHCVMRIVVFEKGGQKKQSNSQRTGDTKSNTTRAHLRGTNMWYLLGLSGICKSILISMSQNS